MTSHSVADITIVTVSYNSSPILPSMLRSIPQGAQVIVVDNGGSDGGQLQLLAKDFGFSLISSSENLGFGRGWMRLG